MYTAVAVGVGCKYKVSQNLELDGITRYMFGYQDKKDVKWPDEERAMEFGSIASNRIRAGVKMNYMGLEKIKLYAGIGYEYELSGKAKGTLHDGDDMFAIPESSYQGVVAILEL
ncbi:hypothetical protein AGMMS49921_00590 [Endomicrobiia bacterium]|nr:hypothetical protein AGMMS49921_00590 [Endomicrobiia bacterium]